MEKNVHQQDEWSSSVTAALSDFLGHGGQGWAAQVYCSELLHINLAGFETHAVRPQLYYLASIRASRGPAA